MTRISFVAADSLRPKYSVEIGWLVTNTQNPHHDHSPHVHPPSQDCIHISEQQGFGDLSNSTHGSRFEALLTKLLSFSAHKEDNKAAELHTAIGRRYMLENSGDYFKSLLVDESCAVDIKKWMEDALLNKGEDVYLVVGLATVQNGNFVHYNELDKGISGHATVPVASAIGGAVQAVAGDAIDVSIGGSRNRTDGNRACFVGVGEQVYAVEYRKVKFRFLQSKDINQGFLESGSRWEMFWRTRGSQDQKNVLEAELGDEGPDEDDLEDLEVVNVNGEEVIVGF